MGCGFNRLDGTGAAPGTTCTITADGETLGQQAVDARGDVTCATSRQDD